MRPAGTVDQALLLQLAAQYDALLALGDLDMLSLPVVVTTGEDGAPRLRFHFNHGRKAHIEHLTEGREARLNWVVGPWYLDPDWIPQTPHAPTEIKLSFEARGNAVQLSRSGVETLADMQQLTEVRQSLFVPDSDWTVTSMPDHYRDDLLGRLVEFELSITSLRPTRGMLMDNLDEQQLDQLIATLDAHPSHHEAARFMRMVWKI